VLLPDPFREMRARRNPTEIQQSGHATRSGPEVKNGRSNPEGAELDPVDDVHRRCKKNFSFFFILHRYEDKRKL